MAQKSASPGLIFRNIMFFDGTFGIWFPMSGQAGLIAVSICHASIQTLWLSFSQDFSSLVREIIVFVQGEENVTTGEGKLSNCRFDPSHRRGQVSREGNSKL
jgi:hypothetical protein